MNLVALPAFADNYLWLLHDGHSALVVDPGDALPVLDALRTLRLRLATILVTHHHRDHTGGVAALREATGATVHGPWGEPIPQPCVAHRDGERLAALGLPWQVLAVPGHTAAHIAWYCDDVDGAPLLFCGDTLFSAGCGRLFEGTPAQMLASLDRLAALPDATQVCCAHEYTLSNLRFAQAVEPGNAEVAEHTRRCEALRAAAQPTLSSRIGLERRISPFLRSREPTVRAALQAQGRLHESATDAEAFAALREWKNEFR